VEGDPFRGSLRRHCCGQRKPVGRAGFGETDTGKTDEAATAAVNRAPAVAIAVERQAGVIVRWELLSHVAWFCQARRPDPPEKIHHPFSTIGVKRSFPEQHYGTGGP
jgi:hypothetical protein